MKNAIYDPNQFNSYQDYIIDFLAKHRDVESCINPEQNSQGMDLGRLMDNCSSPLPISELELVANYKKAIRDNELEAFLYYYTDIMMQYWLDSNGRFKPEILAALQSRRIDEQPSLEQVLYCNEDGQPDLHKTAILQEKFIAGMIKNLFEIVSNAIKAEIQSSNDTEEVKEDLLAELIHLPKSGLDSRLYAFPEKMEQEFKNQSTRTYLTQFTSDSQEDQTKVITFKKLQKHRQQRDANKLPIELRFAAMIPEFKEAYNPVKHGSYPNYLQAFLKEDKYVRLDITANDEFNITRLFNNLTTILPDDIDKLWREYKAAIDSNDLESWVYGMVDRMCTFWLDEQGKFKPEIEQTLAVYRREYFNQAITALEDKLSRQTLNSQPAKELKEKIAQLKKLRQQDIAEFLYGVNLENKTEFSDKVITSMVMNLTGLISTEFSPKAASKQDKYISQPLGYNQQGMMEIGKERRAKPSVKVSQFAQQEHADNSKAITFAKLQAYRQEKKQRAEKAKEIAITVNTTSQMAVLGGFGLMVLGTALILSGVGTIPGLAVIGAGAALATGSFFVMAFSEVSVARLQTASATTKPASVSRESSLEVNSRLQAHKLAKEFQQIRAINTENSSTDSSPENSPRDYQVNESATKKTTWGQWARSGFGLFAVSRSEEEKTLMPNSNDYGTHQQQSKTPTP